MNHEQIMDLLEPYAEETLDRPTRRTVDAHLAECEECRAILNGVAPVDLGGIGESGWTPRDMRRAVRRSMLRVAVDALVLLFAAWVALWLLSFAVVQPLVINRGGRAAAATVATIDLATMFNPGVSVTDYEFDSGLFSRRSTATAVLPVGTELVGLGELETRLGIFSFGDADGGAVFPFLSERTHGTGGGREQLAAVGEGTVATVVLSFDDPVAMADAEALESSPHDVRIVWAGFRVGDPLGSGFAPGGSLGYGTCVTPLAGDIGPSGSGGGSRTALGAPASVTRAHAELRRALLNLEAHPELVGGLGGRDVGSDDLRAALESLDEPQVDTLVLTGPTADLVAFIDDVQPDVVGILEVDFINWSTPVCGR